MPVMKEETKELLENVVDEDLASEFLKEYDEDQFVESQQVYEYCVEVANDCGSSIWSCDDGFLGIGEVGDVNLDSTLDILDIVLLLNYILLGSRRPP